MKKFSLLFLALTITCAIKGQDCPSFTAPSGGKSVKVTFYTETDQCFTLSEASGPVNPDPSRRVTFFMNLGTVKTKIKLNNGTVLDKNVMITQQGVASAVYEVVYNEKKGEWDAKIKLGQSSVTEEEKKEQEESFAATKPDQKPSTVSDKPQSTASSPSGADPKSSSGSSAAGTSSGGTTVTTTTTTSGSFESKSESPSGSTSVSASVKVTETSSDNFTKPDASGSVDPAKGIPHGFGFFYKGKPITNVKWVITDWSVPPKEITSAISNEKGVAVFYPNVPAGKYEWDFCMEIDGKRYRGFGYTVTLGATETYAREMELRDYIRQTASLEQVTEYTVEKEHGLAKVFPE